MKADIFSFVSGLDSIPSPAVIPNGSSCVLSVMLASFTLLPAKVSDAGDAQRWKLELG